MQGAAAAQGCRIVRKYGRPDLTVRDCTCQVLELLRPDPQGKVQSVCSMEAFGLIRSMASFRLPGANKDYLVRISSSAMTLLRR